MAEVMQDLGIQEILTRFGIEEVNSGASMGAKWLKSDGLVRFPRIAITT